MKLTKDQKSDLVVLKDFAKEQSVTIIVLHEYVTIVWVRSFPNSNMIQVSTSYFDKAEKDRFRKSTGMFFALHRLLAGEKMQLPIGALEDKVINQVLEDMFIL